MEAELREDIEGQSSLPAERMDKLDLNRASAEELATLPGINDRLARRIVRYRKEHGDLHAVENLTAVKGLTPEVYEMVRDRVMVVPPFRSVEPEGTVVIAHPLETTDDETLAGVGAAAQRGEASGMAEQEKEYALGQEGEEIVYHGELLTEETPPVETAESGVVDVSEWHQAEEYAHSPAELIEATANQSGGMSEPADQVDVTQAEVQGAEHEFVGESYEAPVQESIGGGPTESLWTTEAVMPGTGPAADSTGPAIGPESPAEMQARTEEREGRRERSVERAGSHFLPDLGLVILGGLLGTVMTLAILWGLNGSLLVNRSPVVVNLAGRVDSQANEVAGMRNEVTTLQQTVQPLTDLPGRMDTVESSVGQMGDQVTALQESSQRTTTFFQNLQGLLLETFGPTTVSAPQ